MSKVEREMLVRGEEIQVANFVSARDVRLDLPQTWSFKRVKCVCTGRGDGKEQGMKMIVLVGVSNTVVDVFAEKRKVLVLSKPR